MREQAKVPKSTHDPVSELDRSNALTVALEAQAPLLAIAATYGWSGSASPASTYVDRIRRQLAARVAFYARLHGAPATYQGTASRSRTGSSGTLAQLVREARTRELVLRRELDEERRLRALLFGRGAYTKG
jgi:hypothetical protein